MRLKIEEVESLNVEGVDTADCPDFCDAFFTEGIHIKEDRDLTEDELTQLQEDYPEVVSEMAYMSLID